MARDVRIVVSALAAGDSVTVDHGLDETPNYVMPDRATAIVVDAATSTSVTFRNAGSVVASANFLARAEHSIITASKPQSLWQGAAALALAADLQQSAARWDDLMIPDSAFRTGGTAPAFTNWLGGLYAYGFGEGEQVFFEVQMPHCWAYNLAGGAVIKPHVHLAFPDNNAGNYVFGLEYSVAAVNGTFGVIAPIESAVTAAPQVTNKHIVLALPSMDLSAYAGLSTMLSCRLYRKNGVAGAYGSDIIMLEFDFHVQKNDLGSHEEYIK